MPDGTNNYTNFYKHFNMKNKVKSFFSEAFVLKAETHSNLTYRHKHGTIDINFSDKKNYCNIFNMKGGACFDFTDFVDFEKKFKENEKHLR